MTSVRVPPTSREEYIEECVGIVARHVEDNGLFVIYVRKHRPHFAIKVSEEDEAAIRKTLSIVPNMTVKSWSAMMLEDGTHIIKIESKNGKKERITVDPESIASFRTIKSVMKSNQSPIMGVIVGFKHKGQTKIGWSLCNLSKNDKFNREIGIRKAIDRAVGLPELESQIVNTKQTLKSWARNEKSPTYTGPENSTLPHSCLPYLEQAIRRATAVKTT